MRMLRPRSQHRGLTAVMALMFLALATVIGMAMYSASTTATASASKMLEAERARAAAESGMRWLSWRFEKMNRPKTPIGNIDSTAAASLWPAIRTAIATDLNSMLTPSERPTMFSGGILSSAPIAVDETASSPGGARFAFQIRPHPLTAGDPLDARYLRVTGIGTYRESRRVIALDFKIDKKVKFAIVGKVPIQLGRNTLVEGPIGMATPGKYPPIYTLSDFHHLNATLASRIDQFQAFLKANHKGYDNRINVNNPDEFNKAAQAGFSDYSGDQYIDEYDLFLAHYDRNNDKAISKLEFTDPATNLVYDPDLFAAIDSLGPPLAPGEATRAGYLDGSIDSRDAYSKIRGQLALATDSAAWSTNLAGQGKTINDMLEGPISPTDGTELPVKFNVNGSEMFDLSPTNFDTSGFRAKTGPEAGATQTSGGAKVQIANKVLSTADTQVMKVTNPGSTTFKAGDFVLKSDFDAANAPLASTKRATGTNTSAAPVTDRVPYGSTNWQATYQRPVFRNMHFKNVRIPKGINALFDNCTFEGVTYVEVETNVTDSAGATTTSASEGMKWSKQMKTGTFDANTALTTATSKGFDRGNNLRFNNCTINGPLASDVPTAYAHFTNSWEFTGATLFDNKADQTATMVCPQTNVEMGSFTDPSQAPSTLIGVVVAGNLDIRGSSVVDGSIIVTGDGAGNTTQGWFGPSDANTDPSGDMPEGGWGRLNVRYNPNRALPDGINIAIDILPEIDSYSEIQ